MRFPYLLGLLVVLGSHAAAAQTVSLWNHNGSTVGLWSNGSSREFRYVDPREGLPVSSGELLFRGSRDGSTYEGVAFVFSSLCGPAGYSVTGPVSPNGLTITLRGAAPVRDSACRVVDHRDDILSFQYIGPAAALPAVTTSTTNTTGTGGRLPDELSEDERKILQLMLMWTGDYGGPLDGIIGPATARAITAFQTRSNLTPDGRLTDDEIRMLGEAADRVSDAAQFRLIEDPYSLAMIGIPFGLVDYEGVNEVGGLYNGSNGRINIVTLSLSGGTLEYLYDNLAKDIGFEATYRSWGGDWFVMSGSDGPNIYYARAERSGSEVRGFALFYNTSLAPIMGPVVTVMSNLYRAFPSDGGRVAAASPPAAASPTRTTYYGTGFVIAADGTILTNAHVVEGCTSVTVGSWGVSSRISRDETNDLARLIHKRSDFGSGFAAA